MVLILVQVFGLSESEVAQFIDTIGTILAVLAIYYGRYRQGDITWYGKKID
jgi:hypothetical protein